MINIKRCKFCGELIQESEPLLQIEGLSCHAKCYVISKSLKEFARKGYNQDMEHISHDGFNFICFLIRFMFICPRCQGICQTEDCMDRLYKFLLNYEIYFWEKSYGQYCETKWKYRLKSKQDPDIVGMILASKIQNTIRGF